MYPGDRTIGNSCPVVKRPCPGWAFLPHACPALLLLLWLIIPTGAPPRPRAFARGFCLECIPLLPHPFSPALAETLFSSRKLPLENPGLRLPCVPTLPVWPHHSTRVAQIGCESSRGSACQCGRRGFDPWVGKIPREKEMAAHSSTLAWRIPWTEEPGGLQSTESHRVRHDLTTEHIGSHLEGWGEAQGR